MSDICEREDHSLKSMNFGASGKDCPYCRIEELEEEKAKLLDKLAALQVQHWGHKR